MLTNFSISEVLKLVNEPLIILSSGLNVVGMNLAAEEVVAKQYNESIAMNAMDLLFGADGEDSSALLHFNQFFIDNKPYSYIRNQKNRKGESIFVQAIGVPLYDVQGQVFLFETMRVINHAEHAKSRIEVESASKSEADKNIQSKIQKVARTKLPVLLYGESGIAKTRAATLVHELSSRHDKPFLVLDCKTFNESLLEVELFGYEQGAIPCSNMEKKGLVELADGGTLFLDEIAELPLPLQSKLLRVLEYHSYRRIGGTDVIKTDVRIVCATNRNLFQMVKDGTFRKDLYFRLAVFPIVVPSLTEKRVDIALLADGILKQISVEIGLVVKISLEALDKLNSFSLSGNVSELRNILQYAAAVCENGVIKPEDLFKTSDDIFASNDNPPDIVGQAEITTDCLQSQEDADLSSSHMIVAQAIDIVAKKNKDFIKEI